MTIEYNDDEKILTITVNDKTFKFTSKFDAFRKLKYLIRRSYINQIEEIDALNKISNLKELPLENKENRNKFQKFEIFVMNSDLAPEILVKLYYEIEEFPPAHMTFKMGTEANCRYGRFHLGEKVSKKILSQNFANNWVTYFASNEIKLIDHSTKDKLRAQIKSSRNLPINYKRPENILKNTENDWRKKRRISMKH